MTPPESTPSATARRRGACWLAAIALTTLAACSDDEPAGDDVTDATDAADQPSDSLAETLSTLGGETVADVGIEVDAAAGAVTVGGLTISVDAFTDYVALDSNVDIPPTWPTLTVRKLIHETDETRPDLTWAVLAQTELATDEAARSQLAADLWASSQFTDAEVVHTSELTSSGGAVRCWTEVRLGAVDGFDPRYEALVVFAGSGIASSALDVFATNSDLAVLTLVGDVVDSACGTRPDGL